MPRQQKPLTITRIYIERTEAQKKEDYARFVQTLTPAQRRAMIIRLEQEIAEEKRNEKKERRNAVRLSGV